MGWIQASIFSSIGLWKHVLHLCELFNWYWIIIKYRDHFVYKPSEWETRLQWNVASHWLGAYKKDPCGHVLCKINRTEWRFGYVIHITFMAYRIFYFTSHIIFHVVICWDEFVYYYFTRHSRTFQRVIEYFSLVCRGNERLIVIQPIFHMHFEVAKFCGATIQLTWQKILAWLTSSQICFTKFECMDKSQLGNYCV